MPVRHILFVCSGNTCRSPMAAALFRQHAARHAALGHITVASAGTAAHDGDAATSEAIQVIGQRGIDLGVHRAQQVDAALVQQADLILTMTPEHMTTLRQQFPDSKSKVFTVGEYAGSSGAIHDPLGRGLAAYQQCAEQLDSVLARIVARLAAEAREEPEQH